ncbi:selenoprotein O-like isoform X2 [Limulus polyphemus]|uniref:Selenoprotein O n=1 Tax=Limulus polyphemus TaxID=6850 RepID=A0ABM1C4T9_LIMPO|nr:selenoprotein O-like isoform X2 [Limulus polyphemus]
MVRSLPLVFKFRFSRTCYTWKSKLYRLVSTMTTLETLEFDNLALRRLPIDQEERNFVRVVEGACFSKVSPTPLDKPEVVAYSLPAMSLLGLPETELRRKDFADYFSGNKILPGSDTAAHCYCGHQFGYFAGQLGDGAAIYLGEIINEKRERWEIQVKGAGPTPYSRSADGRKVLRSSIREFLCSEAMHHLGIPTTRAGACITSDSKVVRDIFYDGHPKEEKCSVVLRIAPTFLRFGSFEIFKTIDQFTGRRGPSVGRKDILHKLLDYTVETFYPEVHTRYEDNALEKYREFFKEVVLRTARLVAAWQCVGFCHGVLNTDNMSILGLTIDYGPYGFLDMYDPDHICNASDDGGRYTFIKQPEICHWNLKKLAEAIQAALPLTESLPLLDLYFPEFELCYFNGMRNKLGLHKKLDEDRELVQNLFKTMEVTGADFTNTFRCLLVLSLPALPEFHQSLDSVKNKLLKYCASVEQMIKANQPNMDLRQFQLFLILKETNPELLEQLGKGVAAIERVTARIEKAKKLQECTQEQKQEADETEWSRWLDQFKKRLAKEIEGLSSEDEIRKLQQQRLLLMKKSNPRFVLRNFIAQQAIDKAEKGDYSEVLQVLKVLEDPYSDRIELEMPGKDSVTGASVLTDEAVSSSVASCSSQTFVSCLSQYEERPPEWAMDLRVT